MEKNFLATYSRVFSNSGDITACGRSACIDLINLCDELGDIDVNYGDATTGFVNIPEVKELAVCLFPEIVFREQFFKVFDENGEKRKDCSVDDLAKLLELMTSLSIYTVVPAPSDDLDDEDWWCTLSESFFLMVKCNHGRGLYWY